MIGTICNVGEENRKMFEERFDAAIVEHFDADYKRDALPDVLDPSFLEEEITIEIEDYKPRVRIMKTWLY
jgi:hypothetical protein